MGHKPIEGSNPFVSAIILVDPIALFNYVSGFWAALESGAKSQAFLLLLKLANHGILRAYGVYDEPP